MRMVPMTLAGLLLVLLMMALWGDLTRKSACNCVTQEPLRGREGGPLFVLVHGFDPDDGRWKAMAGELQAYGDVLRLNYDSGPLSNADPYQLAREIGSAIDTAIRNDTRQVVLVAHSMGALLARRAVLDGLASAQPWAARVRRLVLLAGMNRGWTVEGKLAPDASVWLEFKLRIGRWLGRMLGTGELLFHMERGAPFVSDLRLAWMQHMHQGVQGGTAQEPPAGPEVIQLLGDIDDFVQREDNEDLRTTAVGRFALIRVRGTGHGDIIDLGKDRHSEAGNLGPYRREKLLLAATADFRELAKHNEELPPPVSRDITEIVFVLHGIRDLGRWSSTFESEIRQGYPDHAGRLLIVSPRYGYLGMGPFLFEGVRDRYVRWFMDQYTETLARYPMVKPENIRFFGHSNGSYLLAAALDKYKSMKVGRVVLAGSVVRASYDWTGLGKRVGAVRNYVGTHDWVVALFPRFFELPGIRQLDNRLGGGGFHGFADCGVQNILVDGAHGAFDGHEKEIVRFLMEDSPPVAGCEKMPEGWNEGRSVGEKLLGSAPVVLGVWGLLIAAVLYLGVRVVGAAAAPNWPVLVVFILLVVTVLRTA